MENKLKEKEEALSDGAKKVAEIREAIRLKDIEIENKIREYREYREDFKKHLDKVFELDVQIAESIKRIENNSKYWWQKLFNK